MAFQADAFQTDSFQQVAAGGVLDDFTDTAGTTLPTHKSQWIGLTGTSDNLVITNANRARCNSVSSAGNYWDVSTGADDEVVADLHLQTRVDGAIYYWVARGRKTGAVNHFIYGRLNFLNSASVQWQIGEAVEGTFTTLKSSADISPNPVTGDDFLNVEFIPSGTGGSIKHNGTTVLALSGTGAEQFSILTGGYCGLRVVPNTSSSDSVGGHFDNFNIPALTGPAPTFKAFWARNSNAVIR